MTMRSDPSPRQPEPGTSEPELKAIVADLWHNSERLVQQELQLAVVELEARVDKAKVALRQAAIAGGLFHAAYLTTLATLVLLLSEVVAPWLAALLVAVIASAAAYAFTRRSKHTAREAAQPPAAQEPFPSSGRTAHP
jgi:uncharacterized membrane protein YqjE